MSKGEKILEPAGVGLCVETFGDAAALAVLLIHGAHRCCCGRRGSGIVTLERVG